MNILKFLTPKSRLTYMFDYNNVRRGIEILKKSGYTAVPVLTEEGEYFGTVTEGDFLRCVTEGDESSCFGENIHIFDAIRKDFNPPLRADADFDELVRHITEHNFVPVIDDKNSFVGIVTRKDVIQYLLSLVKKSEE